MDIETVCKEAKKGNDSSFYMLIDHNKSKLYKIAFAFFNNEVDSLEAIQEVTYRAYINLHKLNEPKYFNTWITRILINYCKDELKRKKRVVLSSNEQDIPYESINTDRVGLDSAISLLDPTLQTIIILKYFHEMTISEIAQVLKRPEGTIKTWLHKALQNLRTYLNKDGETYV